MLLREPTRSGQIAYGVSFLTVGVLGLYAGIRGFIAFYNGSHEAPADPVACTIGLVGGAWLVWIGIRLCAGSAAQHHLISQPLLLLLSIGCLGGAVWMWRLFGQTNEALPERLKVVVIFGGAGILGLILLWRRAGSRSGDQ